MYSILSITLSRHIREPGWCYDYRSPQQVNYKFIRKS